MLLYITFKNEYISVISSDLEPGEFCKDAISEQEWRHPQPKIKPFRFLEKQWGWKQEVSVDRGKETLPTLQPIWKNILLLFDLSKGTSQTTSLFHPANLSESFKSHVGVGSYCSNVFLKYHKCYNISEKLLMVWASFIRACKIPTSEVL